MTLALVLSALAGDPTYWFKPATLDTDTASVSTSDTFNRADVAKVKVSLENKTGGYLVYDMSESVGTFGDQTIHPAGGLLKGTLILDAKDSGSRVLEFQGAGLYVDSFQVDLKGVRVGTSTADVAAEDFQLPEAVNSFEAGGFSCALAGVKKKTKETQADFKCTYEGEGLGLITANRAAVRIDGIDGQKFANDNKKARTKTLLPGESAKITLLYHVPAKIADMQFATMYVVWGDTFQTVDLQEAEMGTLSFELDPGVTAAKNE
jgi:hypothetical protein